MLLAAGLGTRMRPLTDATAKPLLPLGGRPLIDHALDHLVEAGVETVVVNAFWQADRLAAHLAAPPRSRASSCGARPRCWIPAAACAPRWMRSAPAPFYVVNGDAFWLNGPRPALAGWPRRSIPAGWTRVLLVYRTVQVHAEVGFGDFVVDKWGGLRRRGEREVVPYVYAGVQLVSPGAVRRRAGRARSA